MNSTVSIVIIAMALASVALALYSRWRMRRLYHQLREAYQDSLEKMDHEHTRQLQELSQSHPTGENR